MVRREAIAHHHCRIDIDTVRVSESFIAQQQSALQDAGQCASRWDLGDGMASLCDFARGHRSPCAPQQELASRAVGLNPPNLI